MKPIIEVNHVWKEYQKGIDRRYKSLRDTLVNIPGRLLGEQKEKFWALEDIDFTVEAGESVGIIGRNGAGKSTLLKILSRITPPTKGEIILRGRVASLLEVGTGFHPELTGRENVFFNGSILGMKHAEIKRKFDEIVAFSGVESFIDTPLKHYSSGMQMRLAFSVAAHLDSEILLIDEVLAVGDAEFQKKCIGKMDEVSKGEGKTILFVSHNLNLVTSLCPTSFLIKVGKMGNVTQTKDLVMQYLESFHMIENIEVHKIEYHISNIVKINCINTIDSDRIDRKIF
ncbi:MAG: ABC transporter ATP-binding protein [Saprospiraceae bacterium]|nr:ABC transporter ATP-binding protein [Saprospiraceae bacterium]